MGGSCSLSRQLTALTTFSDLLARGCGASEPSDASGAGHDDADGARLRDGGRGADCLRGRSRYVSGPSPLTSALTTGPRSAHLAQLEQNFIRQHIRTPSDPDDMGFCRVQSVLHVDGQLDGDGRIGSSRRVEHMPASIAPTGDARQRDARAHVFESRPEPLLISTDPPYYDNMLIRRSSQTSSTCGCARICPTCGQTNARRWLTPKDRGVDRQPTIGLELQRARAEEHFESGMAEFMAQGRSRASVVSRWPCDGLLRLQGDRDQGRREVRIDRVGTRSYRLSSIRACR